jgi:hypothetical protein
LRFNLHKADFLTAARVRDAINSRYPGIATIADGVSIELALPPGNDARSGLLAEIEMLAITPAPSAARVIVNSRTGTVVINQAVRLAPAAISHGKLVLRIEEAPMVVQPAPFSRGPRREAAAGPSGLPWPAASLRHCTWPALRSRHDARAVQSPARQSPNGFRRVHRHHQRPLPQAASPDR